MFGEQIAATAFANELMAIGVGVALLTWAGQSKKFALAKVTGYFIAILAFIALLCTVYCMSSTAIRNNKLPWYSPTAKSCANKMTMNNNGYKSSMGTKSLDKR